MKPYLAIIRDSFREALATKVLWVILVLCVAFLAVLLPFSVTEYFPKRYGAKEVLAADEVFDTFSKPTTAMERHVASSLPTKPALDEIGKLEGAEKKYAMMGVLNELLDNPKLYDPISMKELDDPIAMELVDKGVGSLSHDDVTQLNRRILAELFPRALPLPDGYRCDVKYAEWMEFPMFLSKSTVIDQGILSFATFGVSIFGVLLPLLFTAGMVPRAFESGSVEMTLSKPITRSFVFLAKYFGGCSFAFIMVAVISVGTFFICGIRLDHWQWRLLLCIPVFVFNFGVYYTVSAVVGLVWRNTIMALFFGLLFLLSCWGAGKTKQVADELVFMPNLPTHVEVVDDDVFASTVVGLSQRWDAMAGTWQPTDGTGHDGDFLAMAAAQAEGIRFVGPVYDPVGDRLLRLNSMSGHVQIGTRESKWAETSGPALQPGTIDLLRHADGTIYFIAGNGISRFDKDEAGKETIVPCSPTLRCGMLAYCTIHPITGDIAICGSHRLVVLARNDDGSYATKAETNTLKQTRLVLGFLGRSIIGVDEEGVAHVFDANLKETDSAMPVRNEIPRTISASRDGKRLYMLYHNQELWTIQEDAPTKAKRARIVGQGTITAATILRDGTLAIGWDLNRVTIYDETLKPLTTYRPKMEKGETFYRFGVVPLYTVFPKPTEISNFTTYLITGKLSHQHGRDATVFRPRINVWQPIWSCAIFVTVALGIGCLYVSRKDF